MATVYTSVGGKPTLLRVLIETSVNAPETVQALAEVERSSDPDEILRITARNTRQSHQRDRDLVRLMVATANLSPTEAERARQAIATYRGALRRVAVRLDQVGGLRPGLTVERATSVLWFYFGLHAWPQLLDDGWPPDEAEQWLRTNAAATLLILG